VKLTKHYADMNGEHHMSGTTTDWHDYTIEGFFRVQFPAYALADDLATAAGGAAVEITAEAGVEDPDITVTFLLDHDGYVDYEESNRATT
jgi:hypothetical protein